MESQAHSTAQSLSRSGAFETMNPESRKEFEDYISTGKLLDHHWRELQQTGTLPGHSHSYYMDAIARQQAGGGQLSDQELSLVNSPMYWEGIKGYRETYQRLYVPAYYEKNSRAEPAFSEMEMGAPPIEVGTVTGAEAVQPESRLTLSADFPAQPMTDTSRTITELIETQSYQQILPGQSEQLKQYLANDGVLSDSELAKIQQVAERQSTKLPPQHLVPEERAIVENALNFILKDSEVMAQVTVPNREKASIIEILQERQYGNNQPAVRNYLAEVLFHAPSYDIKKDIIASELVKPTIAEKPQKKNESEKQVTTEKDSSFPLRVIEKTDFLEGMVINFYQNFIRAYHSSKFSQALSEIPSKENQNRLISNVSQRPDQSASASSHGDSVTNGLPGLKNSIYVNPSDSMNVNALTEQRARFQWKDVAPTLEKFGLTEQVLRESGNYEKLMKGGKTDLMTAEYKDANGQKQSISGRFYLYNTPEKGTQVYISPEQSQFKAPAKFLGYEFTPEDRRNLETKGELGRKATLIDKDRQKPFQGYVGVDPQTKRLTVLRSERVLIPMTVKGVTLTKQQQQNLEEGKAVKLAGLEGQNGQKFNAYVQVSAAKRSLSFAKIPDNAMQQTVDQKTQEDLQRPAHQLQGGGQGATAKTIAPKQEAVEKQSQATGPVLTKTQRSGKSVSQEIEKPAKSPRKQQDQGPSLS